MIQSLSTRCTIYNLRIARPSVLVGSVSNVIFGVLLQLRGGDEPQVEDARDVWTPYIQGQWANVHRVKPNFRLLATWSVNNIHEEKPNFRLLATWSVDNIHEQKPNFRLLAIWSVYNIHEEKPSFRLLATWLVDNIHEQKPNFRLLAIWSVNNIHRSLILDCWQHGH